MRSFRFNDAMEGDLAFLMEMWGCTATDAMTRALCSSAALERAFAICRPASGVSAATAESENPTPSTPVVEGAPEKETAMITAPTPGKTKSGNKVRWQLKLFLLNDNVYSATPKAISGETEQIAIANAKKWLAEHGHSDFEPFFPAGKHCKTFKI